LLAPRPENESLHFKIHHICSSHGSRGTCLAAASRINGRVGVRFRLNADVSLTALRRRDLVEETALVQPDHKREDLSLTRANVAPDITSEDQTYVSIW
jgi:hypothetical protein